jgi:hypothetical protein
VTVRQKSDLTLETDVKEMRLDGGFIESTVAPQTGGARLRVTTPHARAEVKGTRFRMGVSPALTRLDVWEGTVGMTGLRENDVRDVAAGYYAMAGSGLRLMVRPLTAGDLADRAGAARTVSDLRALKEPVRAAYLAELARGGECAPLRLLNLGLAAAIVSNPREDRQAEDLGFALARAATAGADPFPDRRISGGICEMYGQARADAADHRYESWHTRLTSVYELCRSAGAEQLCDAAILEFVYVTFYERGLPYGPDEITTAFPGWGSSSAACRHFDTGVLPSMADAARTQRRMQRAIEIVKGGRLLDENGKWQAGRQQPAAGAIFRPPDISGVFQQNRSADRTVCVFDSPRFEEAVFAGQVMARPGRVRDGFNVMWYLYFKEIDRTWGVAITRVPRSMEGRWMWFRVRFHRREDASWDAELVMWPEGVQPHDLWMLEDPLSEDALSGGSSMKSNSRRNKWKDLPRGASLALSTTKTGAVWRAVGVRIIRPVEKDAE